MALTLSLEEKVVVITSVPNIKKACNFVKLEYVDHFKYCLNDFIYNKRYVIKEIHRLVEIISNNEFHFSHTQFAVFNFFLVKALNDAGKRTVFHNFEFVYNKPNFSAWNKIAYIELRLYLFIFRLLYGTFLTIRMSTAHSFMLSLRKDYIQNNCKRTIDNKNEYYDITLKMFKEFNFEYPEIRNLFIAQTFSNERFFDQSKINNLIPSLNISSVSIKTHPKLGAVEGLDKCIELPAFLPVELFFKKVTNCIISIHSASLITASKFINARTISLLDLVKTNDPFLEEVKTDLLLKSGNNIKFPNNLDQLEQLLNNDSL